MSSFLLTLGGLALGGSAAILLLALAGRLTRARYGARWRCLAWALLCLRLAVPVSLLPQVQQRAPVQVDIPAGGALVQTPAPSHGAAPEASQGAGTPPASETAPTGGGSAPAGETAPAEEEPALSLPALFPALALTLLWGAGAAAVLLRDLAAHLRFLLWLRRWGAPVGDGEIIRAFNRLGDGLALSRRPRLLLCPGLRAPMLAGVLRPAVLLPEDSRSGPEVELALLHELTHLRRRDIWLRALALWVRALYWFDPLCWWMLRLISRDTELACDEEVLGRLPPGERGAYGRTILSAAGKPDLPTHSVPARGAPPRS